MRVLDIFTTNEIKYNHDHIDKITFALGTLEMCYFRMKCISNNYYRATNFWAECFDCDEIVDHFYVGKVYEDSFISHSTVDRKNYKAYTYIFKCPDCYDEVFDEIVGEEFYDSHGGFR